MTAYPQLQALTTAQLTPLLNGTYAPAIDLPSGKYVTPTPGVAATGSPADQQVRAVPIVFGKANILTGIAASITGAGGAGSVVRLGIYNDLNGLPGTLLLDAGTINGTSPTVQAITISQAVNAGKYWLASCPQGAPVGNPTMTTVGGTSILPGIPLTNLSDLAAPATALFRNAFASGAFPASFGPPDGQTAAVLIGVKA